MRALHCLVVSIVSMTIVCFAQDQVPSTPQPQPTAGQPSAGNHDNTGAQNAENTQQSDKKPSRLKRAIDRAKPDCIHVGAAGTCWDNGQKQKQPKQDSSDGVQSQVPTNQPPPREAPPAGESSSRQTQIDISPPPGDVSSEPIDTTDVTEMHPYDPHRAAKDVEVGDFYFHRKNYRAAESRYAGALQWKPNDAIAMFRLAQSEEMLGKKEEALKYYQSYINTLPNGDFAKDAKAAIERLSK